MEGGLGRDGQNGGWLAVQNLENLTTGFGVELTCLTRFELMLLFVFTIVAIPSYIIIKFM